jgi:hypothetical protein
VCFDDESSAVMIVAPNRLSGGWEHRSSQPQFTFMSCCLLLRTLVHKESSSGWLGFSRFMSVACG